MPSSQQNNHPRFIEGICWSVIPGNRKHEEQLCANPDCALYEMVKAGNSLKWVAVTVWLCPKHVKHVESKGYTVTKVILTPKEQPTILRTVQESKAMTQDNEFSCFNQDQILNTVCQAEQKHDREQMEETTLQRIAREAAEEIAYNTGVCMYGATTNEIASIIYKHFRNGKEL